MSNKNSKKKGSNPEKTIPKESRSKTFIFIIILCLVCGLILSTLATVLKEPQERAQKINEITELFKAAQVLGPKENFQIEKAGKYLPAKFDTNSQKLVPISEIEPASDSDLWLFFQERVRPLLTDSSGKVYTFQEANLNYEEYVYENKKSGFAHLKYKLFYLIMNADKTKTDAYVIPINGFGLWDAIYGYIALKSDAVHVIGSTWYDQKETPGLGAEISSYEWQEQFQGKSIFQEISGTLNLAKDPIGIIVVKGKVKETYPNSALAKSAVDGISGATLTGNGVMQAYQSSLRPYRAFLIRKHEGSK